MELIGFVLFLAIMLYALAYMVGGAIKANAVLNWEWRQLKRFFKWIMTLIMDFIIWICKFIKGKL